MKPITVLVNALQDVIARSFGLDAYKIKEIREIAQFGLSNYKKAVPEPEFTCPEDFVVGMDYKGFPECGKCPDAFSQICSIYNYVYHRGGD